MLDQQYPTYIYNIKTERNGHLFFFKATHHVPRKKYVVLLILLNERACLTSVGLNFDWMTNRRVDDAVFKTCMKEYIQSCQNWIENSLMIGNIYLKLMGWLWKSHRCVRAQETAGSVLLARTRTPTPIPNPHKSSHLPPPHPPTHSPPN